MLTVPWSLLATLSLSVTLSKLASFEHRECVLPCVYLWFQTHLIVHPVAMHHLGAYLPCICLYTFCIYVVVGCTYHAFMQLSNIRTELDMQSKTWPYFAYVRVSADTCTVDSFCEH